MRYLMMPGTSHSSSQKKRKTEAHMIELRGLTKKFGDFTAVDDLSFEIKKGEFFGLLGPNGAGKTTTISMLSTVLLPTSGEILIDGEKLTRAASAQKRKLAVITQEYSMRQDMTMDEVMEYQGRLYYMQPKQIKKRSDELLEFAGLSDFHRRTVRHLSGGMKRKLMICRALLIEPEILLLDEPTAGMDALSRRQMWNLLRQVNDREMTILLTTHYIEEAEALCDRVAMINQGRLQKLDTPSALINELGAYTVDETGRDGLISTHFGEREEAIRYLEQAASDSVLRQTTLEDVFIECAGRKL